MTGVTEKERQFYCSLRAKKTPAAWRQTGEQEGKPLFKVDKLNIRINFIESILGSAPADPDIFTRFVSAKAPSPWQQAEENDTIPERVPDTGATVFHRDKKGLFLFDYHLRGFLKESGNILKDTDSWLLEGKWQYSQGY